MSLFGRRDNASSTPASAGGSAGDTGRHQESSSSSAARSQQRRITHIAPGTRIQGEVTGPTELLVEGEIQGEVRVDAPVIVGAEGVVHGPISAQVVRVGGRVFGSVQAVERVEVAPSGTLEGDILAPRITIAEGAFFKGRVEMKGDKPEKPQRPDNKAEEARRPKEGGEPGRSTKAPAEPGKP
ncbi:MAG: polymer-forming cytoskeletal protein [Acidobacteriota bacterium]